MFSIFGFGKKKYRKQESKKVNKKPNAKIVRMARKYKVKISKKVGKKRVYKPVSLILRQIKIKAKFSKKVGKKRVYKLLTLKQRQMKNKTRKTRKTRKCGRYITGGIRNKCCELRANCTKKFRCRCRSAR